MISKYLKKNALLYYNMESIGVNTISTSLGLDPKIFFLPPKPKINVFLLFLYQFYLTNFELVKEYFLFDYLNIQNAVDLLN